MHVGVLGGWGPRGRGYQYETGWEATGGFIKCGCVLG